MSILEDIKKIPHNPWVMRLHYLCMGSMILMCYDPSIAAWAGNFINHLFAGYSNLGPALKGVFGGAAASGTHTAAATAGAHAHMMGTAGAGAGAHTIATGGTATTAGAQTIATAGTATTTTAGLSSTFQSATWFTGLDSTLQSQFVAISQSAPDLISHFNGMAGKDSFFQYELPTYEGNVLEALQSFCFRK